MKLKHTYFPILLITLTFFFSHCAQSGSQLAQEEATPVISRAASGITLIVAGGYMSCGARGHPQSMQMIDSYRHLRHRVAEKHGVATEAVSFVVSCYQRNGRSSRLLFMSSRGQERSYGGRVLELLGANSQAGGQTIYLVGHSWGGMLMVETALSIKEKLGDGAALYLTTIDAIDKKYCHPPLRNLFGNSACQSYPTRLRDAAYKAKAMASVKGWHHYYQRRGNFLKSSAIPDLENGGAHFFNRHLRVGGLGPHAAIANARLAWDEVLTFSD